MLLLLVLLLAQNITISGTLKDTAGKSLSGIRVAAMPVGGTSLSGTAYTDKDGRYTLELPPGDYYVAAGNFLRPTYYTAFGSKGVISTSRNRVDFVLNPPSEPHVPRELTPWPLQWDVPPPRTKPLQ